MIRRPPRSTLSSSSAASDVYKRQVVSQIGSGSDAVSQIIFFERLLHADGNGLKVAAGKASVRRIALGEDEQIFFLTCEHRIIGTQKAADIGHAIFLRRHGAAVTERKHLLRNLLGSLCRVAFFPQFDEVRVLGEATGV